MPDQISEPIGKVVALQGQVTVESDAGGRDLQVGSPIFAKDVVATGPDSTLEIQFVDHSVFSQGPSAKMAVDAYVFDPAAKSASNMLLNLAQGTFRTVTGEIAKGNPDGVKLQTPLATIGIRGTGVDFDIAPDGNEKYGIFQYDNQDLVIATPQGVRFITQAGVMLDVAPDGSMGAPRPYSPQETQQFQQVAPITTIPVEPPPAGDEGQGEGEGEGDQKGEGEGEGEGEQQAEGEGEGEGDELAGEGEGKGELAAEGEGEGELAAEGEGEGELAEEAPLGDGELGSDGELGGEGELGGDELAAGAEDGQAEGDGQQGDFTEQTLTQTVVSNFEAGLAAAGIDLSAGAGFGSDAGADFGGGLIDTGDGGEGPDDGGFIEPPPPPDPDPIDVTPDEEPPQDLASLLSGDDTAYGSSGNDYISAYAGNDVVYGGSGDDTLDGGSGNDALFGGYGNDMLIGGAGNDLLHGGEGNSPVQQSNIDEVEDVAVYWDATSAVTVNLMAGTATGGDGTDTLAYVEGVIGTDYADSLYGNPYESNWFNGGAGNDTIVGHYGQNTLYGVTPWYEVSYMFASSGVSVNLGTGIATGGDGTDSLVGISDVSGSAHDDTLVGSSSNNHNWFMGMGGDDSIYGNAIYSDEVSYSQASGSVTVDLAAGRAWGADGHDTLVSIEYVEGSRYADTLVGTSGDNRFDGNGGSDSIVGGGGNDTLDFNEVDSAVTVDLTTGRATQGSYTDTLSGIEAAKGTNHADSFLGDAQNNYFWGGGGNDTLEGGAGSNTLEGGTTGDGDEMDFASYAHATSGVTVNLNFDPYYGKTTGYATDTLYGIEGVIGSDYNDSLVGKANSDLYQIFVGGLGNDTFVGNGGDVDVSYADATGAVTVTMSGMSGQVTGAAGTDSLYNVAEVTGSNYADVFTGGSLSVYFNPRQGNDQVTGGTTAYDVVNYSSASGSVTVDLAAGRAYGADGNDTLSAIEYVYGSQYNDTIYGDSGDNRIRGRRGDDYLDGRGGRDEADYSYSSKDSVTIDLASERAYGGSGNDTLYNFENARGSNYADTLIGNSGDNTLSGQGGDDWFRATDGYDTYYGGSGDDQLSYQDMAGAVTVNLAAGWAWKPGSTEDDIYEVEMVRGSEYADSMVAASNSWSALEGGGGDDTLVGQSGASSRVYYRHASGGVTVDLAAGTATGAAGNDSLVNFTQVEGSAYADCLVGDSADNYLRGRGGNDTLVGGAGDDMASFRWAGQGVSVDLAAGTAHGEGTDSLSGIEDLEGSSYADTLLGDSGENLFRGRGGDDWIDGGAGQDRVSYSNADSAVLVVLASHSSYGPDGNDMIYNVEHIEGSSYNDTLYGDDGDNNIRGRAGDDYLDGLGGNDTASYKWASGGVTVSLTAERAEGADGLDTLVHFENLLGSEYFGDSLEGDANANIISGLGGADTMAGLAGDDCLVGGDGADSMDGGDGNDWMYGDAGNDCMYGGNGEDWMVGGDGDDTLDGGPAGEGPDWVSYHNYAHGGMVIDLNPSPTFGTASDSLGGYTDKLTHIENVAGSQYDDSIMGDSEHNTLQGWEGNDELHGGSGNDAIYGGTGNDQIYGDGGDDTLYGGDGNDVIHGGDGTSASAGFDRIIGGQGDDQLDAGTMNSNSILDYSDLTSDESGAGYQGVAGSLSGTFTDPWGDTDTVSNFTRVVGTQFNDSIMGSTNNDTLWGMDGNDTLSGGAGGTDTLDGGNGGDTYYYADTTHFESTPANADTILSFVRADGDKFLFGSALNGLDADNDSVVDADKFFQVATYDGSTGVSGGGPILVWDTTSDQLVYDSNGSASGGMEYVANVTTSDELVNTDMHVA